MNKRNLFWKTATAASLFLLLTLTLTIGVQALERFAPIIQAQSDATNGSPADLEWLLQTLTMPMACAEGTETEYKIVTDETGLYQVTHADLLAAGLNPIGIDTSTFQLFNHDEEVAFLLFDGDDGSFDSSDYLLFYAEEKRTRYTSHDIYWLTVGKHSRLLPTSVSGAPVSAPFATSFRRTLHFEEDAIYRLNIPREGDGKDRWYWRYFCGVPGRTCREGWYDQQYEVTLPALSAEPHTANLAVTLHGSSEDDCNPDHQVQVSANSGQVGDSSWLGATEFVGLYDFDSAQLDPVTNTIRLDFPIVSCGEENAANQGYVNSFDITYQSDFLALDNALAFGGDAPGLWQYQVEGLHRRQHHRPEHRQSPAACMDRGCRRRRRWPLHGRIPGAERGSGRRAVLRRGRIRLEDARRHLP